MDYKGANKMSVFYSEIPAFNYNLASYHFDNSNTL